MVRRSVVLWALLFGAGILVQGVADASASGWRGVVLLAGGAAGMLAKQGRRVGFVVALFIVALGAWRHGAYVERLDDGLQPYIGVEPVIIHGVVSAPPEEVGDRTYYVVKLTAVEDRATGRRDAAWTKVRMAAAGPALWAYGDVLHGRVVLQRPRGATNPGAFDYKQYLARQGITATTFVPYPRHVVVTGRHAINPFVHWADRIRRALRQSLDHLFPQETAQLLAALILGERRALSHEVEGDFRRAGVSHLLAVSGMHVGFVAVAARQLVRRARISGRWSPVLSGIVVWLYVFITGARPPAVRAGIAGTLALAAHHGGRPADGATGLALSGLLLMGHNPLVLYDVSFQLSFVAMAAIVVGFAPLRQKLVRWRAPSFIATPLALGMAAQWGVLPLLAHIFYDVSTVGLVAGLMAAPAVALLVPVGLGLAVLWHLWPWAAGQGTALVHGLASWLMKVVGVFSALPWAYGTAPRPTWAVIIALWMLGVLLAQGRGWPPRRRRAVYAALALLLLLHIGSVMAPNDRALELTAIDVGQGDALFIRTPRGTTALVDGGGLAPFLSQTSGADVGENVLLPYLRMRGLGRVDVVINTHPHEDHLQGVVTVLDQLNVGLAVDNGHPAPSPTWTAYVQTVEDRRIPRHVARVGDVLWLDDETRLEVLHPASKPLTDTRSDPNNNSVVLRLVYRETSALLTGDIETEAQLHLLETGAPLSADVLKVPHHGSRLGLVSAFYDAVGAKLAVITVGSNNHGHPSSEVIEALHRRGAAVYRTDVHGAVTFVSDGRAWRVTTTRQAR